MKDWINTLNTVLLLVDKQGIWFLKLGYINYEFMLSCFLKIRIIFL